MSFGEQGDSLGPNDRASLIEAVRHTLPSYRLSWHANADAMVWAVLDQQDAAPWQPRFTICRLDHCLVMMVEAGTAARQFCSAATIDDAVALACGIARDVMTPCDRQPTTHEAPTVLQ